MRVLILTTLLLGACHKDAPTAESPAATEAVITQTSPPAPAPAPPAEPPTRELPGEVHGPGQPGSACQLHSECSSGICEGLGCGEEAPGTCASEQRTCTRDRRAYCGCDGQTFFGSGTCPNQRYAHKDACEGDAPIPRIQR